MRKGRKADELSLSYDTVDRGRCIVQVLADGTQCIVGSDAGRGVSGFVLVRLAGRLMTVGNISKSLVVQIVRKEAYD
jgi:hypothetical protein